MNLEQLTREEMVVLLRRLEQLVQRLMDRIEELEKEQKID